jgi:zinc transporter ZupT
VEHRFWIALAASLMAAAFTTAGIAAIRRFEKWAQQNSAYFVCFAAGVLIAASFSAHHPQIDRDECAGAHLPVAGLRRTARV